MASTLSPFQLLEINLISAQDLANVARTMRTYAKAWVHPDRKLTTRVDTHGGANPTWNDKFVFRVDDNFLRSDMSAVMIEIYNVHWFRDVHVGTVRVLVSNLIPPQIRSSHPQNLGMRFVALQVRRPSGRPQGILNIGVTVLDSTMRSMPLYTYLDTSALGYQQLMGTEDLHRSDRNHHNGSSAAAPSTRLRRTKSERSSMLGVDEQISEMPKSTIKGGSTTMQGGGSLGKRGVSEIIIGKKGGKILYDKPLSVIDGASDLAVQLDVMNKERTMSTMNHSPRGKGKNKAANSSIGSQSDVGMVQIKKEGLNNNNINKKKAGSDVGAGFQAPKPKHNWLPPPPAGRAGAISNNPPPPRENYYLSSGGISGNAPPPATHKGYPISKDFANGSVWSESEVGPSPSEVAAAIAEDSKYRQLNDGRSSILDDKWSVDDGTEGLRTKLDRWRTALPTLYDYSSFTSTAFSPKHVRRHTEAGGKFSCFGNIAGFECSIVCGRSAPKRKAANKRLARAPSLDSMSTYF